MKRSCLQRASFSLIEVVLALGVLAFAVLAVVGLLPIGLSTGHAAQDETRSAHIAQEIFASFASQAQKQFTAVTLPPTAAVALDLSSSTSTISSPALFLYADNDGTLSTSSGAATHSVSIATNSSPAGFAPGGANAVSIRVISPPLPSSSSTPSPNQTVRDFVRVISKY